MEKVDSATGSGIAGAEFALEKKGSDGTWAVVAEGIVSGKKYRADVDGNGAIVSVSEAEQASGGAPDEKGSVLVSNLPWGTYRFVETKAAEGYTGVKDGQWAISGEATVSAENVEATLTTPDRRWAGRQFLDRLQHSQDRPERSGRACGCAVQGRAEGWLRIRRRLCFEGIRNGRLRNRAACSETRLPLKASLSWAAAILSPKPRHLKDFRFPRRGR